MANYREDGFRRRKVHKNGRKGRKEKYDTPEEGKRKKHKNELQGGRVKK